MRAIVPAMAARREGDIVNIASTAGLVGYRYFAEYVAAKYGLIRLTKAAALVHAPFRVRANVLGAAVRCGTIRSSTAGRCRDRPGQRPWGGGEAAGDQGAVRCQGCCPREASVLFAHAVSNCWRAMV